MDWSKQGTGTPTDPHTWTWGDWKIEKHPFAGKYTILHRGQFVDVKLGIATAQEVADEAR